MEPGRKLCALCELFDWQGQGGGWEGLKASWSSGLGSPGFCSEMSFPALWRDCMKCL